MFAFKNFLTILKKSNTNTFNLYTLTFSPSDEKYVMTKVPFKESPKALHQIPPQILFLNKCSMKSFILFFKKFPRFLLSQIEGKKKPLDVYNKYIIFHFQKFLVL
jgi:hypothetical protein